MEPDIIIIIVQNLSQELFVHQRSANKKMFPLFYGLGAGGYIESGEAPAQAAKRELKEELDIDNEVEPLFSFHFASKEVTHNVHVFKTMYDGDLTPSVEFQWSGWMSLREVDRLATENKLCPDTKVLYEKWKGKYLT